MNLDDLNRFNQLDSLNMLGEIDDLPDQLARAFQPGMKFNLWNIASNKPNENPTAAGGRAA